MGGYPDAHWSRPISFAVFCIGFNFVMAWVFNRTNQSLPLAMLAHVGVNNFMSVAWNEMFPTVSAVTAEIALGVSATIAAAVIIVLTRGRLGYTEQLKSEQLQSDRLDSGEIDESVLVRPDNRLKAGANT